MELGRAAQRLAGAHVPSGFSGVMHDEYGEAVLPLQGAQVREQRCDFAAGVFIDAVQAHEGIEHQQAGRQLHDGFIETRAIDRLIEPHAGGGDHVNIQIFQIARRGGTDTFEPATHDVQGIFRGVEQYPTRTDHGEAAQARRARGDGDGQIQSEEGFAALGFPADYSDGLFRPQTGDQPALLLGTIGETVGLLDGQRAHRRRPATLACAGEGAAKSSKNSFSSI